MRKWLFVFLVGLVGPVGRVAGTDLITSSITFTNFPTNGATITIQGSARTWTNNVTASPGTQVQQTNSIPWSATNLLNHLTAYPAAFGHFLNQSNATNVNIRGRIGEVMAVTTSGGYAVVTYSTQVVQSPTFMVRQPYTVETPANQTNIASWSAKHLTLSTNPLDSVRLTNAIGINGTVHRLTNGYYTNAILDRSFSTNAVADGMRATNAIALHGTNFWLYGGTIEAPIITNAVITNVAVLHGTLLGLTNGVLTATRLTNGVGMNGTVWGLTNGYYTNAIWDKALATNLTCYLGISCLGTNAAGAVIASERFGSGANATNIGGFAAGPNSLAGGVDSTAVGYGAIATNDNSSAFGFSAIASTTAFAGGEEAYALALGSTALGSQATIASTHIWSTALGAKAATTESNQIVLGRSNVIGVVTTTGRIQAGSLTNNTFTGTNVNSGDWSDDEVTMTSLANGNNVVATSNYKFIRLAAGPTGAFTINSLQGGRKGREIDIWNDTGQALTVANESGYDATNVNRIVTSGADVVFGTNVYLKFRYSAARSRWKLSGSRE